MRYTLSLFALLASSASFADTIVIPSKVSEVTIHPNSTAITRSASFQLEAGRHQLVFQGIPDSFLLESLRVDVEGARQIGTVLRDDFVPPDDLTSPEVERAKLRVRDVERRIQIVRDEATQARTLIEGAQLSVDFLRKLGDSETIANAGAENLREITRMIREETASAGATVLLAEVDARRIEEKLEPLWNELEQAKKALAAVDLQTEDRVFVSVEVDVEESVTSTVEISYLVEYSSFWTPVYDLHLTTGDTPTLRVQRDAVIQQDTGENWEDVTLHLSTLQPVGQTDSGSLRPRKLAIHEEVEIAPRQKAVAADFLAEPVVEAPVVIEETAGNWQISAGVGVTYSFAQPVSVASGADLLRLELSSIEEGVDIIARAVPRLDETAYRVASFENTSGEDLLSSEAAARYVDGALVGSAPFEFLAAGASIDLGFGPIDGLKLSRDILDQNEGDEGIITRSNRRDQEVEIEVVNVTGKQWTVRVLDQVPFSTQEDLKISWDASPNPTRTDVKKQRGIMAWDLDMQPGDTEIIRLETSISWPDGMILR
ncbi:MAG: DUF4139 domain-containing protein [Paracoccaceae bacterium]